jgi:hypothetical protein
MVLAVKRETSNKGKNIPGVARSFGTTEARKEQL